MSGNGPAFYPVDASGEYGRVDLARDRIASLLRQEPSDLGLAVFDLWAAFDELVDPLAPPRSPRLPETDEPVHAMSVVYADLVAAIDAAETVSDRLRLGRAAHHVSQALATHEVRR